MHIHDTHRHALLVIAFAGKGEIKPDCKEDRGDAGHPWQDTRRQAEEPCRVGQIGDFRDGETFGHWTF
ncbi:hypothetical protein D3C80_1818070 [compost metagenome]